ncbi:MAG: DUF5615 family PIN-like protein [Lewinellaceae bacterium]|nr:DUF5615 family PIN-like protein [Saprospiraceae bacterium]MCB9312652.1 DUF5615 family PIN-like protein [Lewinellaceae bacterium]HRW74260.1 DUF5615 family PIN-like protein [Saprospiraceae bacterium]
MTTLHFLADESVDYRIVKHIRALGFGVYSVLEEHAGSTDDVVLALANKSNTILITEDKDFGELIFRLKKTGRGIILLRFSGLTIDIKRQLIDRCLASFGSDLDGKFVVISKDKMRIKAL